MYSTSNSFTIGASLLLSYFHKYHGIGEHLQQPKAALAISLDKAKLEKYLMKKYYSEHYQKLSV